MSQEDPSGYPYQPYGAPYGEQPPPPYGYGYPPPRRDDGPSANAIVSLVLNLLALLSCCNVLGLPGAILAGLALSKARTEPRTARTMLIWSWIMFGLGFVLGLGLVLFLGLAGYLED
jgi:cytochrome c biogenesis protein CcdA